MLKLLICCGCKLSDAVFSTYTSNMVGCVHVCSKPRLVEEVIEFRTTVGVAGILCRTKVSCSFVTPVVKFSEDAIEFRLEMVGAE